MPDHPARVLAAVLFATLSLAGCVTQHKPPVDPTPTPEPPAPLPSLREAADLYNPRLAGLDRLWSRITLRIRGEDARGNRVDEETEGHLIIQPPKRLSLSVTKLGEAYFLLGSNDANYWWFDLSSADRTASIGAHEALTPGKASDFGLPVHPLDLIDLLAITPIDPDLPGAALRRDELGTLQFISPTRFGRRLISLDERTWRPTAVTLLDSEDAPVVSSSLSEFEPVAFAPGAFIARKATLEIVSPSVGSLEVQITLYEPEVRTLNPKVFDLQEQVQRRGIVRRIDLDAPRDRSIP